MENSTEHNAGLPVAAQTDSPEATFKTPEKSIILVAKVVYLLHGLSILLGIVTGASILGSFLFGWPSIAAVVLNYALRSEA